MMKFTDMNIDCLEIVLEYLDLIDLLNVADSTRRLNKVAELVFARRYRNKRVNIEGTQISRNRLFKITKQGIDIKDLKTSLQLLRCVGAAVFKINFNGSWSATPPNIDEKVCVYINKYCARHLNSLDMFNCYHLLEYFDTPFPNVTSFHTETRDIEFREKFCLNKLFPNVEQLSCFIDGDDNSIFEFDIKHFPHLNSLTLIEYCESPQSIRNDAFSQLLCLNPQLKKLYIGVIYPCASDLNMNLIWSAVNSLQNIEKLFLRINPSTVFDNRDNMIHMKSVKDFGISLFEKNMFDFKRADTFELPTRLLPFSFGKLEKFEIFFDTKTFFKVSLIDQLYDFIDRHPSIMVLKIHTDFVNLDWLKVAKSLPSLVIIQISGYKFFPDKAIELMAKLSMVKEFNFELEGDCNNFLTLLGKQWQGMYTSCMYTSHVHLKRKI